MNRRRFLELLSVATAGSTIAYSFPSIIVPRNISRADWSVGVIPMPIEAGLTEDFSLEAWSGNISSFQHWPLALTSEQIMAHYEATRVIFE